MRDSGHGADVPDRPLLFVRCDAGETFGVARSAVEDAGGRVQVWDALGGRAPGPRSDAISGVVVFGSSFNVEHADEQPFIKEVRELTREAVERGVPYLGVCFGAQLLAWSLDGDVVKAPVREGGVRADPAPSTSRRERSVAFPLPHRGPRVPVAHGHLHPARRAPSSWRPETRS